MSDLPPSSPPAMPVAPTTSTVWEPPKPPAKPRRAVSLFDRVKILVVLAAVFAFLLWRLRSDQPAFTFGDTLITQLQRSSWILVLALIEVVRQLHYLVSEQNAKYNHFWVDRVWGGLDRWKDRRDPWLRYRTARAAKFIAAYLIFSAILANRRGISFGEGVSAVPGAIYNFLTVGPEEMPFWVSLVFPLLFIVGQFGFLFFFLSRGGVDVYMPEDVTTTFDDVWGQDHVLEKVKENVLFLENPRLIEERGGHVPGGILLWGPPGTGKTLMAEAVAGQTGRPYVFVDPGAFINMFMGVGILKVKSLFRKLRKLSLRYGGVIVFFDEADSLGNRGSAVGGGGDFGWTTGADMDHLRWLSPQSQGLYFEAKRTEAAESAASAAPGERRGIKDRVIVGGMGGGGGTLQALLSEISGLKKPRGFLNRYVRRFLGLRPKPPLKYRILVMMATNMPDALDDAMLRPGRIDRIYKVGYPSKDGRRKTYEGYLRKVAHQLTPEQVEKLAVITPYATGAKIKDLINEALINAIRSGREAVTWEDIIWAKHFKELGPPEDVEYIERERHAVAVHEACHAVAAYRVRRHMHIDLATIEKGGNYLGMVASIKPEDQFTNWKSEYESDIIVCLASLAGERLFFDDDNSNGVTGDLQTATYLASLMEALWGMGDTVTSHLAAAQLQASFGAGHQIGLGVGRGPKGDNPGIAPLGERVEANLKRLLEAAHDLLIENWFEVLAVAHALETHKTMAGEDVEAVIDGVQGPLIDGRIYKTQQMRDELTAYHELVAAAHRHHGRVEAVLPKLELPIPSAVAVDVTAHLSQSTTIQQPYPAPPSYGSTQTYGTPPVHGAPPADTVVPQPPTQGPVAYPPPETAPRMAPPPPAPAGPYTAPPPMAPPTMAPPPMTPPPGMPTSVPTPPPGMPPAQGMPPQAVPPTPEPPVQNGGAYPGAEAANGQNGHGEGDNGNGTNGNGSHDGGGAPPT